jgi:hypothetical protein
VYKNIGGDNLISNNESNSSDNYIMDQTKSERRKYVVSALLGLVAVVLLWRAIWDFADMIMSPFMSLVIGFILLGILSFVQKDYIKKLF